MALPTGQLSISQVNTELGKAATTSISLNDTAVRTLAGVASGQISFSNLLGKSAVARVGVSCAKITIQYSLAYYGACIASNGYGLYMGGSINPTTLGGAAVAYIANMDFTGSSPQFFPMFAIKTSAWTTLRIKDASNNIIIDLPKASAELLSSSPYFEYMWNSVWTSYNLFPVGATRLVELL